ncbi:uncharacterized protein LOC109948400 isoform X1 [Prunus persica]|nr:uncharacterized protein LOC109948400 isoform X1 [Prunus persica]XP_020416845.1 uncharacterized protein LOC109948400 isoform X1 [Prunus persica]
MSHSCWVCNGGTALLDFDLGYHMGIRDNGGDYKLRWVCFKKLCYIHNQQFILVACSFSVLSSSSLLFSLIHLFRVVSRLGFDFCSSFVFSGDSFGRGVEGLETVRSIASFWFITKHTFVNKFQRGTIKR